MFGNGTLSLGQKRGFADVFKRGRFAWEYKAPGKPLDAALRQLMMYALRQVDAHTNPANTLDNKINEYAAELARVTVCIGELQWRLQHGYPFKVNPVLDSLDQIECRDALLTWAAPAAGSGLPLALREDSGEGALVTSEAAWPRVEPVSARGRQRFQKYDLCRIASPSGLIGSW